MTTSPDVGFPQLAQSQATPEITFNEVIVLVQALVNGVIDKDLTAPPGSPAEGDTYLINTASPTGAWSLHPYAIAIYWGATWRFVPGFTSAGTPITLGTRNKGLRVYVRDEDCIYTWTGAAWSNTPSLPDNSITLAKLVNAAAQYDIVGRKTSGAGAWEDCTRANLSLARVDDANAFSVGQTIVLVAGGGGGLSITNSSGSAILDVIGDGLGATQRTTGYGTAPTFALRRAKGSLATPTALVTSDNIDYNFQGYNGSAFTQLTRLRATTEAVTPSSTDMQSRFTLALIPPGSVTITEMVRLDYGIGLSMYGANIVIDANRIIRPRSYTIATLPSVTATGIIHCSDLGGGEGLLQSNGAAWLRVREQSMSTLATDASRTLTFTYLTTAPVVDDGAVAYTANRTVTLSTTGAVNGARARFIRRGTGAFNWDIGGLKTLSAANTFAEVTYNGTAWVLTDNGSL